MVKSNLGRGINNLLEENELEILPEEKIVDVPLNQISPNPKQPRIYYNDKKLNELKDSINEYGLMQPIILKPTSKGYTIIAGERRFKAIQLAGLTTIPAVIRDYNSRLSSELALIENIQREDLTSIEEAATYKQLIKDFGYTHAELAKKIGKSRSHVTNIIGLLNLPEDVIEQVLARKLSMGHARILSKLSSAKKVQELTHKILEEKMSVRDLERLLEKGNQTKASKITKVFAKKMNIKKAKLKIQGKKIILTFDSKKELDTFIEGQLDEK